MFSLALFAFGAFAAPLSWADGAPATPPVIKLVGPSPLTEHLKPVKGAYVAIFNLSVENDGPASIPHDVPGAGGYNLSVVSDREYSNAAEAPAISLYMSKAVSANSQAGEPVALASTTVTSVPVALIVHDADTTSLTIILSITSPSGVLPSTEAITLTRSPLSSNFTWILIGSLIMGACALAVAGIFGLCTKKFDRPPEPEDSKIIYTAATFSFGQSWAGGIAGILTIVVTVFSATGVLSSLVPGIDTGFFLGVTIVYGVVIALAPLVYSTFQTVGGDGQVYGRHIGFVIAAAVTAIAVGGQLSTIGAIVWLSDLDEPVRRAFLWFLSVVAALVIVYIEATRQQLRALPKPSTDPTKGPPSPPAAMAALP